MTADAARPFARAGLVARVAPFAAVAVFAMVVDAVDAAAHASGPALAAALLVGLTIILAAFLPWARLPRWADVIPPLLYVLAVMLIRHSAGGAESGVLSLFALPLVWAAVYGDRAQVVVVIASSILAVILPLVVIGPPSYPPEEWQRVLVNGAVATLVGVVVHVLTQRLRVATAGLADQLAERAASEGRLAATLAYAHDAIVTLDTRGVIVGVNPAAERMFRGPAEHLIGRNLIETMAEGEEQRFLRQGMADLVAGTVGMDRRSFGTELRRLDGEIFPADVSVGVVAGPSEVLVHAFARDATDRRRADALMRRQVVDLDLLLSLAQTLGSVDDPGQLRRAICEGALALTDGDAALLVEPDGESARLTASAGSTLDPDTVARLLAGDDVRGALASGGSSFRGASDADPQATCGLGGALWQGIPGTTDALGVVVVGWTAPMPALDPRVPPLLGLLARQAGVAMQMAGLVRRLSDLARTDGLTGVANRRTFDEALGAEVERAKRSDRPLSLVMLDLDRFKAYNDRLGHQAGDRLLTGATAAWQAELRPTDVLARYGGEEFAVILPDCTVEAALQVAERLRARVPDRQTVSAGVASWEPAELPDELIARADAALYLAKAGGRDRSVAI